MRCVNAILTGLRLSTLFNKSRMWSGAAPQIERNSAQTVCLIAEAQDQSLAGAKPGASGLGAGPEQPVGRAAGQTRGAGGSIVSVIGTITLVEPTQLTVGDKIVVVGPGTALHGVPATGLRARAQGWLLPDRNIVATSVEILLP